MELKHLLHFEKKTLSDNCVFCYSLDGLRKLSVGLFNEKGSVQNVCDFKLVNREPFFYQFLAHQVNSTK